MIIRLYESDIRRMVLRCLNEMRSDGQAEIIGGVNDLYDIAWQWVLALRDKENGGKGFSEYNGRMYSVDDWYSTMYKRLRSQCRGFIKTAVNQGVSDLNNKETYTKPEMEILNNREQDDPYFQSLAIRPNKFINPSDDTVDDMYSGFFTDVDNPKCLLNKASYISHAATDKKHAGNLVLTSLKLYIWGYLSKNKSEWFSMSKGNGPYPQGYNFAYDTEIPDFELPGMEKAAAEMVSSDNVEEARIRLKHYFETLLIMLKKADALPELDKLPRNASRQEREYVARMKEIRQFKFDNTQKPYLIHAAQFIVDNFDDVFPKDEMVNIFATGKNLKLNITQIINRIKFFVASKINNAYNNAIKNNDAENPILGIFGNGGRRLRTPEQTDTGLSYLWRNIGKYGKDIRGGYADMFAESVNRAVKRSIIKLKKRGCI